jgi:hypothetical protein
MIFDKERNGMTIFLGIIAGIAGIAIAVLLFGAMMIVISPAQVNVSDNMKKIMNAVLDEREKQEEFREYQRNRKT